jgi:hypothetical protein
MPTLAKTFYVLVVTSFVASAFFACGGTKTTATPDPIRDSAADVLKVEAASPTVCADASIDELPIPDASVGDSGINTNVCFACLKTTCSSELAACNRNCDCRNVVVDFLTCSDKMPQNAQMCAFSAFGSAMGEAAALSQNVGQCAFLGCQQECIPAGFLDAGSDANANDASDAGDASDASDGS